jgi:LDH2 family malate/lactate/ureidoglycolate dehydrogenase
MTVAELMMRQKLGRPLEPGTGIDRDGNPTNDPAAAWMGAIVPWGGHRGYGVALAVQLLGILGGGATVVRDVAESGFFFLVIDPELLMPSAEFRARVSELVRHIESSRPSNGVNQVRVHGMASARRRLESSYRGFYEIDDSVHQMLLDMRDGLFKPPTLSNRKGAGQ